jgi:hypothetical protein
MQSEWNEMTADEKITQNYIVIGSVTQTKDSV